MFMVQRGKREHLRTAVYIQSPTEAEYLLPVVAGCRPGGSRPKAGSEPPHSDPLPSSSPHLLPVTTFRFYSHWFCLFVFASSYLF